MNEYQEKFHRLMYLINLNPSGTFGSRLANRFMSFLNDTPFNKWSRQQIEIYDAFVSLFFSRVTVGSDIDNQAIATIEKKISESWGHLVMGLLSQLEQLNQIQIQQRQMQASRDDAEELVTQIESLLKRTSRSTDKIIEAANLASFRTNFRNTGRNYFWESILWLGIGTILATIIAVNQQEILNWYFSAGYNIVDTNLIALQYRGLDPSNYLLIAYAKGIILRILFVVFLIGIFRLIIRNYFNARHNRAVNIHKANALTASLNFLQSTDDNVKGQIISQVISSVFAHQPTAYDKSDPENMVGFITDVGKAVTNK